MKIQKLGGWVSYILNICTVNCVCGLVGIISGYAKKIFFRKETEEKNCWKKKMLVISGMNRSGGTLMSQLLDGPEIAVYPGEFDWGRRVFLKKRNFFCLFNPDLRYACRKGYFKKDLDRKLSAQNGIPFAVDFFRQGRAYLRLTREDDSIGDRLNKFFWTFFLAWQRDLRHKSPLAYCFFFPKLLLQSDGWDEFAADESVCICYNFRCPYGWLNSLWKRSRRVVTDEMIADWCERYCESNQRALALSTMRKVAFIDFEDLTLKPDKTLAKLLNFFDIHGFEMGQNLDVPTVDLKTLKSNSSVKASFGMVDPSRALLDEQTKLQIWNDLSAANQELIEKCEASYRSLLKLRLD